VPSISSALGEVSPARIATLRLPRVARQVLASDLLLLSAALPPHGFMIGDGRLQFASLDHAVWFHAPFRADDWLFYDQEGTWAGASRALCRGSLFDRDGTLVASVVQEGLLRVLQPAR
jgi:acyl-CoA thioesterase-2